MVNLNKDHMDELYSKIHDEHQCVTSKSLCVDLGITRRAASQLLEEVPNSFGQSTDYVYEVTRCVWKKMNGKSVARLRTCNVNTSTSKPTTKSQGCIYSIALVTPQNGGASIKSGHAYTMTLLRDALLQQDALPAILCPNLACDCIISAEKIQVLDTGEPRRSRIIGMAKCEINEDKSMKPGGGRKTSIRAHSSSLTKPKTVNMTAASFFATNKSSSVKISKDCKVETKISKKIVKKDSKPEDKERLAEKKERKVAVQGLKKTVILASDKKRKSKVIGDADDFVGDEDEDDDFIEEDKERQRRNAVAARKSVQEANKKKTREKPQRRTHPREDNIGSEVECEVDGAMDAYASYKTDVGPKGSKRRKKVLEEKTFQDEKGYFRTETVTVWKDVEDIDSNKSSNVNSSCPSKTVETNASGQKKVGHKTKPKNMKQQGLFGYFTAKKK